MSSKISSLMMMLTTLVVLFSAVSKMKSWSETYKFHTVNYLMLISLTVFFSTSCLAYFFVTFEMVLPLIMVIISVWGYQPERLQASMYLLVYTMVFSLPFILALISVSNTAKSSLMSLKMLNSLSSVLIWVCVLPFLVKCPIYYLHFWLPKAHVEAPVMGSIMLAGILLKLGGFGVIFVTTVLNGKFSFIKMIVMMGCVLSVVACCTQTDQKSLVAFASVNHMSMMVLAMMSKMTVGLKSAVAMLFMHGLVSSTMFYWANMLYYKFSVRKISSNNGLVKLTKSVTFLLLMTLLLNFAVPLSVPFVIEILFFMSFSSISITLFWMIASMVMISCYYSLLIGVSIFHYKSSFQPNCGSKVQAENLIPLASFTLTSVTFVVLINYFL